MYPYIWLTAVFLLVAPESLNAQNLKSEQVEYSYIKLPLEPLHLPQNNFYSSIIAAYEAENEKKKGEYAAEKRKAEEEYEKAMQEYPARVKAAQDKYNAELEEWNKKSLGEKVVEKHILDQNNKPVEQIPAKPSLRIVPQAHLQTSYDYPVIAETYLNLGGYVRKNENAVQILVTIHGYDYTQPRQVSVQKNETSIADGKTQTVPVTYYHAEFSYRHPMSVKVTSPDGSVLINLAPQQLNTYKVYKSNESEKPLDINSESLVKTHEERIFRENLNYINDLVNDRIGYAKTTRKAELYYVKAKDQTYQDLIIAFNDASAGLKSLTDNRNEAKTKLDNAVQAWNSALKESDPQNKKARIDKEITMGICFNLLECYFATADPDNAARIVSLLNGLSLSATERKQKEEFEVLFNDLKKRIAANK